MIIVILVNKMDDPTVNWDVKRYLGILIIVILVNKMDDTTANWDVKRSSKTLILSIFRVYWDVKR